MLLAGIGSLVTGIILTLVGNSRNRDLWRAWEYGPGSGDGMITFGVLFIIAGLVLCALWYWKKHKGSS